jgi:hypothetical protein
MTMRRFGFSMRAESSVGSCLVAAIGLAGCFAAACSSDDTVIVATCGDAAGAPDSMAEDAGAIADTGATPDDATLSDAGDSGTGSTGTVAACSPGDGAVTNLTFSNQTYANDPRARSNEAIFTGVNTLDDPYVQTMRLTNNATAAVTITSLGVAANTTLFPAIYRQHSVPEAFTAAVETEGGAILPVTLPAGGHLDVRVQFLSTKANPPSRFDNIGDDAVAAWLVAETSTDCVQAGLYGVSFWNDPETVNDAGITSGNYGRYEPTLGQIIATLGYRVDVGANLETYLNANQVNAAAMAPPPAGDTPSDEVLIRDLTLADPTKPAVLLAVGRFAPKVDYPFGWFPSGAVAAANSQPAALAPLQIPDGGTFPQGLQYVATMSSVPGSDFYSSDHSEMFFPPIYGNTAGTFQTTDSFGLWCFSAQRSDGTVTLDGGVSPNATNGDYNYSYDELNVVGQAANPPLPPDIAEAGVNFGMASPVHRYRFWPLKDRAGNPVANSYLIALEEATNDDYQDMVFTLSNVKPVAADGGILDAGAPDAPIDGADAGAD